MNPKTISFKLALLVGAAAFGLGSALGASSLAYAQEATRTFQIPPQELDDALREFGRQTGRDILFTPDIVAGKRSPGAAGAMTERQALETLLAGSGLHITQTTSNGYAVIDSPRPTALDAADATAPSDARDDEIVVTGTFLRGVAPETSTTLNLSEEDIVATGAMSADQVLRSIPQVMTFNTVSTTGSAMDTSGTSVTTNFARQTNRPNVRDLLQSGGGSRSVTLILVDGHRVVGAGLTTPSPDPDMVPPGILERVEVVLDGGSALYGSDAVGGVINFITRRRVDGIHVDARYGSADDYSAFDTNITLGRDWTSGSAFISYNYATHDEITGNDRDYLRAIDWSTGMPSGRQCDAGNISVTASGVTRTYGLPGRALNAINACDPTDHQFIVPQENRQSLFGGFSQELTDAIAFDLRAYHTERNTKGNAGPLYTSVNVSSVNPFYASHVLPAPDAARTHSVQFNYTPILGDNGAVARTDLTETGFTPSLNIDLGAAWQLRVLANYGESETQYRNQDINTALQQQYANGITTNTALNPYDIGATPNQQLVRDILNWQRYGVARSELINYRAVFDGPLITLPGGEVRAAIGAEYIDEGFETANGFTVRNGEGSLALASYSRDVSAVFGELLVPIVGPDNAIPGIESLSLSLSARRDDYSDFGETTNPKVGLTYEPLDWLRLRANWGESFNAPSPSDQLATSSNSLNITNLLRVAPPGGPAAPAGAYAIIALGSIEDLLPQEATTYSYGVDINPPWLDGLSFSANYYSVEFRGQLSAPTFFNPVELFGNFAQYVTLFPDAQAIERFGQLSPGGAARVAQFLAPGGPQVYQLIDARTRNLGTTHVSGVDFAVRYAHDVGFGVIDLNFAGNYQLDRDFSPGGAAPFSEIDLDFVSRFKFTAGIGLTAGDFRAQARLNHSEGFHLTPSATLLQSQVDSFDTVDLFFRYALPAGWADDAALTLNVNNAFDQDPPEYRSNGSTGITNGSTLGRLIQVGVSTSF